MANKRPEVILLVGMSGAGRSASSNVFEDMGYYVIENLPADLVESVVQSNDVTESNKQLVLTIDAKEISLTKSLEIKDYKTIYKDQTGEIVDRKTWLEISEDESYIIRDISNQRKKG